MFVVGGKGQNGQLYRDVHFLDLVDWTWVEVNTTSTGPSSRSGLRRVGARIFHNIWRE